MADTKAAADENVSRFPFLASISLASIAQMIYVVYALT